MDCNEIKKRLIKRKKKEKKNVTHLESNQRPLPVWIKDGACATPALGTSPVYGGLKQYRHLENFWIAIKITED